MTFSTSWPPLRLRKTTRETHSGGWLRPELAQGRSRNHGPSRPVSSESTWLPAAKPANLRFCGETRNIEIHHVDGHEENTDPANLVWTCRSCNTLVGGVMKRLRLGRRTRQFNPRAQGARTLGQWVTAVLSMKGQSDAMDPAAAIDMIHATPPEQRSRFAQQIWSLRRERGTDRWASRVPS